MDKQKILIEVETQGFEDGAILIFNGKKKKFEVASVDTLISDITKKLDEKSEVLHADLKAVKERYKHQLERLSGLIGKISDILGGNEDV